jgi:hypothetical protein
VPLPSPGPGDDDVARYAKWIAIVGGIVAVVIALAALFGPREGEDGATCVDVPGNGQFVACSSNDSPKDWKERACVPSQTISRLNVTIWSCRD